MVEVVSILVILFLAGTLEVGVFSRLQILYGTADLVMVALIVWTLNSETRFTIVMALLAGFMMSFYSALPMYGYFIIYLAVWLMIQILKRWVWQMPLILLVFVTISATLISVAVSFGLLFLEDVRFELSFVITQIFLPSMTLNLLLAFPTYSFLNDYANWIYRVDAAK